MDKLLARYIAEVDIAKRRVQGRLTSLRRTCAHTHVVRAKAGDGSFLWMCARCRVEAHGWDLYDRMAAEWAKEVSRKEFFEMRPPGPLHEITMDGEIT